MSDTGNPYQSPQADIQTVKPLISQGTLTENMLKNLNGAAPWLRFIGIMGFVGSGSMVLAGLVCVFLMPFAGDLFDDITGAPVIFGGPIILVYTLYFLGGGILVFFPSLFTYRFGAKIRLYFQTNSESELESAFKNNKSLWTFNGVCMIIAIAIIPVMIIIAIIAVTAFVSLR